MYIVFRAGSAGFHYGTAIAGFVYCKCDREQERSRFLVKVCLSLYNL